jgi:Peptidase M15
MPTAFTKDGDQYVKDILWNGYDSNLKPEVVDVLNHAQSLVDFPISLSSGYRSPKRNAAVGGAKKSQHLTGNAVDISVKGLTDAQRTQLTRALVQSGALRLGAYKGNTGLHVDMAPGYAPRGDYPVYAMFDRSANNMAGAQPWFKAGLDGGKIPPGSVPQVATQNSNSAVPTPASVSPQMAFTRQMGVPTYPNTTAVPTVTPRSLAKPAQSPSGVNDRLATQGLPPLPQMRPPAPGYKMSGKAAAQDERFMLGSAAKNPTTQPRVASLGPMAPNPAPRPGTVTLPTSVVQDTFASLGMPMQPQAPTRVADLYAGILPASPAPRPRVSASDLARGKTATPTVPRPVVSASDMVRGNPASQMPRLPQQVAPVPAPRSSRPADPGLNGNPSMQAGTPGMTPNIPAQRPPTSTPSYVGSGFAQMPVAPVPAVRSTPRPPQTYAGQDTNVPRTLARTVMVANPAYKPPQLAAPGAGLTEAQMRAIRGDMSMVAPKPPVVPQFIPQTVSVPNPAYLAAPSLPKLPATPPTVPQPQGGGGLLGMLGGAIQNFDLEGMKRNIAGALAPAILGSVAGRTALIDPMIAKAFTRQVNQPMAGKTIQTANSGQQVIGQRVNNSKRGRTVSQNNYFNDITGV